MEAPPSLYFEPPRSHLTSIDYPKEFKALIFDLYMCFLEEKPENILDFLIRYFETMKEQCGTTKLSHSGPQVAMVDFVDLDDNYFEARRNAIFNETTSPRIHLYDVEVNAKSLEEKDQLRNVLKGIVLFQDFDDGTIDLLLDALRFKKFYEGEYVVQEGDEWNDFFIVDHGKFAAVKSTEDGVCNTIKTYKSGHYFGLQAVFHGRPAPFSIVATSEFGTVWVISRKTFKQLVLHREYMKFMDFTSYINSRNIFYVLQEDERYQLIDVLDVLSFGHDETIFREGDLSNGMYIIIKGKVQFSVHSHGIGPQKEIITGRASQGAHFGELSLVYSCKRSMTAKSLGKMRTIFISSENFQRLLSHRMKKMRKSILLNPNPVFRIQHVDYTYNE